MCQARLLSFFLTMSFVPQDKLIFPLLMKCCTRVKEGQLKHCNFHFRYLVDSVNDGVIAEISIERHEREVLKSKKEVGNRMGEKHGQ